MPKWFKRLWNLVVAGEVIWSLVTSIPVGGVTAMLFTLDVLDLWVIPAAICGLVIYVFLAAYALRRMRTDTEERIESRLKEFLMSEDFVEMQTNSIAPRVAEILEQRADMRANTPLLAQINMVRRRRLSTIGLAQKPPDSRA